MTEVIGAELRLETILRFPKRGRHDSRIGDHHIQGFPLHQQGVRTRPHAVEARKISRDELETTAPRCGGFTNLLGRGLRLAEIAGHTDDMGPVRSEGAHGLHPKTGGRARHQYAFALEIGAR